MMRSIRMRILLGMLSLMGGQLIGQDLHFSHFMHTGVWLSPAECGLNEDHYRVVAGHRNQWATVSQPFVTYHMSLDARSAIGENGVRVGYGLLLLRDQAGDLAFGTTSANLMLSVTLPVAERYQRISAGFSLGYSQRGIDIQKIRFDDSYDGTIFNPSIASSDLPPRISFAFADLGAGFAWEHREDAFSFRKAGVSVWHLNRPGQSFYQDDSIRMDIRYTTYLQYGLKLEREWYLRPEFLFSLQGPYREWMLGSWIGYTMEHTALSLFTIELGVLSRLGDALILGVGGQWNSWKVSMMYDMNYSGLRQASRLHGGWEINLGYHINRNMPENIRFPGCLIL